MFSALDPRTNLLVRLAARPDLDAASRAALMPLLENACREVPGNAKLRNALAGVKGAKADAP